MTQSRTRMPSNDDVLQSIDLHFTKVGTLTMNDLYDHQMGARCPSCSVAWEAVTPYACKSCQRAFRMAGETPDFCPLCGDPYSYDRKFQDTFPKEEKSPPFPSSQIPHPFSETYTHGVGGTGSSVAGFGGGGSGFRGFQEPHAVIAEAMKAPKPSPPKTYVFHGCQCDPPCRSMPVSDDPYTD